MYTSVFARRCPKNTLNTGFFLQPKAKPIVNTLVLLPGRKAHRYLRCVCPDGLKNVMVLAATRLRKSCRGNNNYNNNDNNNSNSNNNRASGRQSGQQQQPLGHRRCAKPYYIYISLSLSLSIYVCACITITSQLKASGFAIRHMMIKKFILYRL